MIRWIGLFFCFIFLFCTFWGIDNKNTPSSIIVVSDNNYPPYIMRNQNGKLVGIIPDLWALWEKKTGIKVQLTGMDWEKAKQFIQEGKADVIDTIFETPERQKIYDFTKPYAEIDVPVFFQNNLNGFDDLQDLQGFTVAVKKGDSCIDVLKKAGISNLQEFDNYEQIVQSAADSKIKVFCMDQPPALYYLYRYKLENKFLMGFNISTGEFHRAVLKNNKPILDLVQNGFDSMTKKEKDDINFKWMGRSLNRIISLQNIILITGIILALILLMFLWNILLQLNVQRQTINLRKSEEGYRQLIELAVDAFFHGDPEGNIIGVNDKACELTGYSRQELMGRNLFFLFEPEEMEKKPFGYEALKNGQILTIQRNVTRKDGSHVLVEMKSKQMPDENYQSFFRDISARMETENRLKAYSERLKILSETALEINKTSDLDAVYRLSADSINRLTGGIVILTTINHYGNSMKAVAYSGLEKYETAIKRLGGSNILNLEVPLTEFTGKELEKFSQGKVLPFEGGIHFLSGGKISKAVSFALEKLIGIEKIYLACFVWDKKVFGGLTLLTLKNTKEFDTEMIETLVNQVAVYIQRNKAEADLRESEKYLRKAQEIAHLGNWTLDLRTNEFSASEETRMMLGLLIKPPHFSLNQLLEFIPDQKEKEAVIKIYHNLKEKGEPFNIEFKIKRLDDGSIRTIRTDGRVSFVIGGEPVEVFGTNQDITEKVKYEEELRMAKETAEKALRVKSQFLSNMSHEIRTPLNGIIGMADLLSRTELNPDQVKYLNWLRNSGNLLLNIVNDVLDLSKLESGMREVKNEEIIICSLLEDLLGSFNYIITGKRLKFTTLIAQDVPEIIVQDRTAVSQILFNLIGNAVKFTIEGGIKIEVKTVPDKNIIILKVTDTGIGIPQEEMENIFNRFTQVDNSATKKFSGTGLGLSIVKSLCNLLKGSVDVESDIGKGSSFTVRLPIGIVDKPVKKRSIKMSELSGVSGSKILIAEDNEINRMALKMSLEFLGFKTEEAANGKAAVEIYKKNPESFSILLLDIQMPVMDGITALKEILKIQVELKIKTPAVALTGYAMPEDLNNILASGFDGSLIKPIEQEKLEECLNQFLSRGKNATK